MAKSKYLRHLEFEWQTPSIPRNSVGNISSEWHGKVREIEQIFRGSSALGAYFQNSLKAENYTSVGKTIEWARIVINPVAKDDAYFEPVPFLYADVGFDPVHFLDMPKEKAVFGEKFLAFTNEAINKFAKLVDGFPTSAIRSACDSFRSRGYSYVFKAGEAKIPRSALTGQIHSVVSIVDTERYLTIRDSSREYLKVKIETKEYADFTFSKSFSGFVREGETLTIKGGFPDPRTGNNIVPDIEVDLSDFPDVNALL